MGRLLGVVIVCFVVLGHQILFSQSVFPQETSGWAAATDAMVGAFERTDVIVLGEGHGRKPDSDFRVALVRNTEVCRGSPSDSDRSAAAGTISSGGRCQSGVPAFASNPDIPQSDTARRRSRCHGGRDRSRAGTQQRAESTRRFWFRARVAPLRWRDEVGSNRAFPDACWSLRRLPRSIPAVQHPRVLHSSRYRLARWKQRFAAETGPCCSLCPAQRPRSSRQILFIWDKRCLGRRSRLAILPTQWCISAFLNDVAA